MVTLPLARMGPRMGRQRGGAGADDGDRGTHQIRVHSDLGEMISWIIRVEGGTTANLLDPMLRAQILTRFERYKDEIEELKKAERALREAERRVKTRIGQREAEEHPKKKRAE